MPKGLASAIGPEGLGHRALPVSEGLHIGLVLSRIAEDGDVGIILRRRSDQGRATNVDLLDRLRQGDLRLGNGGLERVEIHHHQVKGANVIGGHIRLVGRKTGAAQDPPMDAGMEGFDPPPQDFGGASEVGYLGNGEPCRRDRLSGAATADNFKRKGLNQGTGQRHQSGFI